MFFYEVEGHRQEWSSFGRGKKIQPTVVKGHLRYLCIRPFNYFYSQLPL